MKTTNLLNFLQYDTESGYFEHVNLRAWLILNSGLARAFPGERD